MSRLARLALLLLPLLALLTPPPVAAHPLGNFTVNYYSRLEPAGDGVRVVYVLDMAEVPTFQERARIDLDGDGQIAAGEGERYADAQAAAVRSNLRLTLDGTPVPLQNISRTLSFPPGQADLPTLRLEAVYWAPYASPVGRPLRLEYRDENGLNRIGWREIVARAAAADTVLQQASVPDRDVSDELRAYPDDLLSSPLNVREARLVYAPGSAGADPLTAAGTRPAERPRERDVYAALAAADDLSPSVIALSLLLAVALGAMHALSPGHGKTVVAAYLVGSRGTAKHALFLGLTVTITHTAGVYLLGLVTLSLSQYVLPERLYPLLQIVSGLLVVAIGGALFIGRLRGLVAQRRWAAAQAPGDGDLHEDATSLPLTPLAPSRAHSHASAPVPALALVKAAHEVPMAGSGLAHVHPPVTAPQPAGTLGHAPVVQHDHAEHHGLVPGQPPAIAHVHAHGDRARAVVPSHPAHEPTPRAPHAHEPGGKGRNGDDTAHLAPTPNLSAAADYMHGHGAHRHTHDHHAATPDHVHSHGGQSHSHLPPGADGSPVTWRSLLALGVSGGLLPCPSALVVLLSAIALHRLAFGLLLIVAFSVGLAAVLVGLGLLLVYARGFLLQRVRFEGGLAARLLPVGSALVITLLGLAITLQALVQVL